MSSKRHEEYAMRDIMLRTMFTVAVLTAGSWAVTAAQEPAPMSVPPGAKLFVESSEFGQALTAAILKKKVPVMVVTTREAADFFIEENSTLTKEGSAERVAKVIAFGIFAGSGKTYEAAVSLTNRDGIVIFAHNARKSSIKSAAEDVAKKLRDHISGDS